ncbi:MAG: M23 family metallopeptidase [Candidatus Flexifilum sp.]
MRSWWLYAAFIGFAGYLPGLPGELRLLNLLFLYPLIRAIFNRQKPSAVSTAAHPPAPTLPLSPAAGSHLLVGARLIAAQIGILLVPTMWPQVIRQIAGQNEAQPRAVAAPDAYQQRVRYRLPFDGEWYIVNGGMTPDTSHSWDVIAQRYACDFVIADETLRRWRSDGRTVTDYLCYGVPILAPAAGAVAWVRDNVRDAPGPGTGWLDVLTPFFPGCTVVIQHAEDEYSFLAHLRPGSIIVRPGERVEAGQPIGQCGNSGHSTEPHLHFHIQDRADFWTAAGLPIAFDGVSVDGQAAADDVYLIRGTRVRPSAHG